MKKGFSSVKRDFEGPWSSKYMGNEQPATLHEVLRFHKYFMIRLLEFPNLKEILYWIMETTWICSSLLLASMTCYDYFRHFHILFSRFSTFSALSLLICQSCSCWKPQYSLMQLSSPYSSIYFENIRGYTWKQRGQSLSRRSLRIVGASLVKQITRAPGNIQWMVDVPVEPSKTFWQDVQQCKNYCKSDCWGRIIRATLRSEFTGLGAEEHDVYSMLSIWHELFYYDGQTLPQSQLSNQGSQDLHVAGQPYNIDLTCSRSSHQDKALCRLCEINDFHWHETQNLIFLVHKLCTVLHYAP